MTDRVGPTGRAIERLQAEASVADQVIEDLSRALEDSERVCDRYREALVYLRDSANVYGKVSVDRINRVVEDALWTKVEDR